MMNSGCACGLFIEEFSQTEIQDLNLPGWRDHHIAGLNIAMNDSSGMCRCKRVCHLQGDRQSAFKRQRPTMHQLPHIATFDVLHRYKMDTTDLIEIEDGADI